MPREPRDILDVTGLPSPGVGSSAARPDSVHGPQPNGIQPHGPLPRGWRSVWFKCCHVYGRITMNRAGTRYEGRCPKCNAAVSAIVGPDGTRRRIFEAE